MHTSECIDEQVIALRLEIANIGKSYFEDTAITFDLYKNGAALRSGSFFQWINK